MDKPIKNNCIYWAKAIPEGFTRCADCEDAAACYQAYEAGDVEWFDAIPFDGSPLPAASPVLRTGPGAFRPGDHVRSLANGNRLLGVIAVNSDGTLHLWAHKNGHIWDADPCHWVRVPRNEELQCAA